VKDDAFVPFVVSMEGKENAVHSYLFNRSHTQHISTITKSAEKKMQFILQKRYIRDTCAGTDVFLGYRRQGVFEL